MSHSQHAHTSSTELPTSLQCTGDTRLSDLQSFVCMQEPQLSMVELPVKAAIVPTPDRSKRVLWDQFHSIKYPPAYLPRDNLDVRTDILDWHGDHLLTNYHTLYTFLRENGMFVEILSSPYTCFNASQYAVLIVADSEEEFYAEEVTKLAEVWVFFPPQLLFNALVSFSLCCCVCFFFVSIRSEASHALQKLYSHFDTFSA